MSSLRFAAFIALLVAASPLPAQAQQPTLSPELAAVRTQLDKYKDPIVAVFEGYVFSPTNPGMKCQARGYSFAEAAPKMVHPHP